MVSLRKGLRRRSFSFIYHCLRPLSKQSDCCIPGGDDSVGGPNTFRTNIQSCLERQGISVVTDPIGRYRSLLVIQYYDYVKLRAIRRSGVRIVQRLDGLAYPEWAGDGWRAMNEPVREVYEKLADAVVFQSEYSARQADEFLGARHPNAKIVINGVDTDRFSPSHRLELGSPIKLVTSGNFRLSHLIVPQVEALRILRRSGYEVELTVIGPIADKSLDWTVKEPGVRYLGKVSREEIPEHLSEADIFVFSMLNAACPNSVVEAVGAGLPVVGFASGSLPEICRFNQDLLVPMPDRLIHADDEADGEALAAKIVEAIAEYPRFKQRALDHRSTYSMESSVEKYRESLRI